MSNILINTAYFPPVQYFTKVNNCTEIWIEQYESYGKQSYRNRCDIMTANGVMTLSVPVVKGSSIKILTKDVLVDYSTNWQKLHFKGIESAYKNSPYYDYYIDNFMHFFERKEKFLLDLNTKILKELMDNLQLQRPIKLTESTFVPAILIEVVRVAVFPPGIIDAVIMELDTVVLAKIAHDQTPAVKVTKHKRTFQQRQFSARLDGT